MPSWLCLMSPEGFQLFIYMNSVKLEGVSQRSVWAESSPSSTVVVGRLRTEHFLKSEIFRQRVR